jgi:hypothetical protein
MNDDWTLMKMKVQGKVAPPKSYSKDWDDNWEQDEIYYMYSQNTGDFNVLAQISLEMLIETTESFKELAKKYTISKKEVKEHKRLVKISTDLHQKRDSTIYGIEIARMIIKNARMPYWMFGNTNTILDAN